MRPPSILFALLLGLVLTLSTVQSQESVRAIKLPPETVSLRWSDHPGYALAVQKCGICHSADYVAYQPPGMSVSQWTAEVTKMQHAYGAPIDDGQIAVLGAYLASAYGVPSAMDAASAPKAVDQARPVTASQDPAVPAGSAAALLNVNGCLGCHQLAVKVVGPSYRDVAERHRGTPNAAATLAMSIRGGSVGKWGTTQMPSFPNLSDAELSTLATFILQQ